MRLDAGLCVLAAAALLVALTLPRVLQPLTPREICSFQEALRWNTAGEELDASQEGGGAASCLYLLALASGLRVLGPLVIAARSVGIIAGIVTLLLGYTLGRRLAGEKGGLIAVAMIAVTPAFCQGWTMLGGQASLLAAVSLLAVLVMVRWFDHPELGHGVLVAGASAFLLGVDETTSLMFFGVFGLCPFFMFDKNDIRRHTWLVLGLGAVLFGAAWYWFSQVHHLPLGSAFPGVWKEWPADHFRLADIAAMVLWVGPLFLCWGMAGFSIVRGPAGRGNILKLIFVLALGWLLISMTSNGTFGFPTFQAPAALLLTILTAIVWSEQKISWGMVAATVLLAFTVQWFAGDRLYWLRVGQRELMSGGLSRGPLTEGQVILLGGILVLGLLLVRALHRYMGGILGVLLALSFGMNAAVAMIQARAAYQTGYSYGAQGTLAAAAFLKHKVPGVKRVLATNDILYYAGRPAAEAWPDKVWSEKGSLLRVLQDPLTGAAAFGIPVNSVATIRLLRKDPEVTNVLQEQYQYSRIGSYDIWVRK